MATLRSALSRRRAAELTVEPVIDVIAEFGTTVGESVGKNYNIANSRVQRFVRDYMSARVEMINATTRKELLDALERSDDPAAAVRRVFRHARGERAELIAQTEAVRSSNFAAIDAGKWVARLDRKTWASQQDGRVRHTHQVLHGQTVEWNDYFVSPSGARAKFPAEFGVPDEDCGCRCAAIPAGAEALEDFAADPVELYDALRRPYEEALARAWRRVFTEQERAILADL
jgi:uncharacterized protein with gpF-like domain